MVRLEHDFPVLVFQVKPFQYQTIEPFDIYITDLYGYTEVAG